MVTMNEEEKPPDTKKDNNMEEKPPNNMEGQGTSEIPCSQGDCYSYGTVRVSGTRRWLMVTCQRQRPRFHSVFCNDGQFILC